MVTIALRPMRPRDPEQEHRTSTPLELLFDLVFVVAVSFAAEQLARAQEHGDVGDGLIGYTMVFFAIWWAWMNFTWFASAFDTDDWLYRLTTFVQMAGALVIAAGVPEVMEHQDLLVVTLGYVVMRVAAVTQWLRASRHAAATRGSAQRNALGVAVVQVLWLLRLTLPSSWAVVSFSVLALTEIAVPVWAQWRVRTSWHPEHITDRYGAFTLIVLGESVLATTDALVRSGETGREGHDLLALLVVAASGLALLASMWWVYFAVPQAQALDGLRHALVWGYGHYIVFAAAGGVSAGLEVAVARLQAAPGQATLSDVAARATTSVPAAVFLLTAWGLLLRPHLSRPANAAVPILAVVVGFAALLPGGLVLTALAAAAVVVVLVVDQARAQPVPAP